jgi:hypothetical protein
LFNQPKQKALPKMGIYIKEINSAPNKRQPKTTKIKNETCHDSSSRPRKILMIDLPLSSKLGIAHALGGDAHHAPLTFQKSIRNIGTGICHQKLSEALNQRVRVWCFHQLLQ